MGRPFYPHEVDDQDLDWLVSNFLYERPNYFPIESGNQPLVLLPYEEERDMKLLPEVASDDLSEDRSSSREK